MHPSANKIHHPPSSTIIYLNKQRPPIFTAQYDSKHKLRRFQDIYDSPIFNQLSFLVNDEYEECQCKDRLGECPKLKQILKPTMRNEPRRIFEKIKQVAQLSQSQLQTYQTSNVIPQGTTPISQILLPHLSTLLSVIATPHPRPLISLLTHTKTAYLTFWLYSLLCSKLPSYQQLQHNIKAIIQQYRLDIDLQGLIQKGQLKKAYDQKLSNLFLISYPSVVKLICRAMRQEMIVEKLMVCYFVRGRQRKEFQVIKAAMEINV